MQLEVLQDDLAKALVLCSRFTSTRVQLPVLANILLEATKNKLNIASTNLEVSLSVSIGAKVLKEGSITVPSKVVTELVTNLNKTQLSLVAQKENLVISSGDFESKMAGMNSSDFPAVPTGLGSKMFNFTMDEFKNNFSRVVFAASGDETRPVLTGVMIILGEQETLLVATDGFRLSRIKLDKGVTGEEGKRIIIPKNSVSEAMRIHSEGEVEFSYKKNENLVLFGFSDALLSSRTIEGDFPDFERIIPKESKVTLEVEKEDFLRNIKLASVFARDSANLVKMDIRKGGVKILSESQQYGSQKTDLDAKITGEVGENLIVAFNYRFLEDFVNSVKGDSLKIELSDPNSPVVFLDTKVTNYLHIIMPIRLQD